MHPPRFDPAWDPADGPEPDDDGGGAGGAGGPRVLNPMPQVIQAPAMEE
jgi:hypothetical protein